MTTMPATDLLTNPSLPKSRSYPTEKRASTTPRPWLLWLVVVLFLFVHINLILDCALEDFATFDETAHLTAGLSYWQTNSFRLYNVNPPLPKLLGSLPVLLANPNTNVFHNLAERFHATYRPEFKVGEQFARDNASRYYELLVCARSVGLLWSLLGALGVYCWAKALWGAAGGLLALVIWCFEPNILAHAHLLTPDVPAAVTGLWATYLFRNYLKTPSWSAAALAGVVLGLAELCKFTLLLFYPIWFILWLYFVLQRRSAGGKGPGLPASLGQLAFIFGLSLCVINAGYAFSGTGKQLKTFLFVSEALAGPKEDEDVKEEIIYGNRFKGTILGELPVPLPENMVCGIDVQRRGAEQNSQKYNKYLRGEWSQKGWWYYYLYAIAVKVPLGLWGILLFALSMPLWFQSARRMPWGEFLILWLPAVVIFAFINSHPGMQTHLRYVLPSFPFVIVYMGRAGQALVGHRWGPHLVVAGLLVWAAGSYLTVHPNSLSHFNELAGGPERGHEHLEGSSIDWGQDLLRLKRWMYEHPEAKPLKLAYFNHIDPRIVGINFQLPPVGVTDEVPKNTQAALQLGPHPGYFAVSGRFVYGAPLFAPDGSGVYRTGPLGSLEYFHHFQPIAKAGYSIFIYHITPEEANRVRQQYGLPPLPANGNTSGEI